MINDGTALVLYRIAVGVATGGAFSLGGATLEFVAVAAGGIARRPRGRLPLRPASSAARTTPACSIFLSVLTAYGAYVGAEELHVSGILAAVVAGVYAGYRSPRTSTPTSASAPSPSGACSVFGLEITLFVLLGLQLPTIVDTLEQTSSGVSELLWPVVAIAAASIGARLAFVFAMGSDAGETAGQRFAVGWSGMRGAVSLAAALAVPLERRRPPPDHLPHLRPDPGHPGRPGALAAVHRPRAGAGGAAALERRRGGGADGGGAVGARPDRPDGGRGARQRVTSWSACATSTAPASACARRCWAARTRTPRRASSGSPTTASCAAS